MVSLGPHVNNGALETGGGAANGYGKLHIGSVDTENADLAEYYPVADQTIGPGDVVAMSDDGALGGASAAWQGHRQQPVLHPRADLGGLHGEGHQEAGAPGAGGRCLHRCLS